MKLYFSPGACSLSPHIALLESGLPFTLELASTKTHQLKDGTDFYTINPLGYVPVLELDDGTRLREGPAIVQYLADQAPHKNLAPFFPWSPGPFLLLAQPCFPRWYLAYSGAAPHEPAPLPACWSAPH